MRQLQAKPAPMLGAFLMAMTICILAMLQGCAGPGALEKPQNFKESEILTMAIATEVLNQADILQTARKIKPSDARDIVRQTDAIRDSVDIAKGFVGTDLATANDKINATLKGIQALRDYLIKRGANFSAKASG